MTQDVFQHDPKQLIVEYLSNPFIGSSPEEIVARKHAFEIRGIDNPVAKTSTIHFFKECCIVQHCAYGVRYENERGQQRYAIGFVDQDISGLWKMNNIRTLRGGEKATLDTTHPPILFSMGKQSLFWVEGHIRTSGFDIARIRLISNTGQILEDRVEEGFVLFLTDQPFPQPVVEIFDHADALIDHRSLKEYFPNVTFPKDDF